MKNQYQIEKWKWNQDDFEQMGWHDCPIWAMSFNDDVKFDLDYIFKWEHPQIEAGSFRFWISPATLVFKNPSIFKVEMETEFVNGLEVADIVKENIDGKTNYIIESQEGQITIQTEEFVQIIRRPATLQISQGLTEMERGAISFSEVSEKTYISSKEEIKYRRLSYKFEELRNEKTQLQIEYDDFKFVELSAKERKIKEKEYKSKIDKLIKALGAASNEMDEAIKINLS